jgi:hypothetical protein
MVADSRERFLVGLALSEQAQAGAMALYAGEAVGLVRLVISARAIVEDLARGLP